MKNKEKYLAMFQMLLDGINPNTGEYLPKGSVYASPDMLRALHYAIIALSAYKDTEGKPKPGNAGAPWTVEEDEKMVKLFNDGVPIKDIAKEHERTEGAIESRLVKMGLLKNRYEAGERDAELQAMQ